MVYIPASEFTVEYLIIGYLVCPLGVAVTDTKECQVETTREQAEAGGEKNRKLPGFVSITKRDIKAQRDTVRQRETHALPPIWDTSVDT